MKVNIYTDGSCLSNGKVDNFGGYGVVVIVNGKVYKGISVGTRNTTNNEMELEALLKGVKIAKVLDCEAEIYSDSSYCVNIVNDWMYKWVTKGWKKADKRSPENLEIIEELYCLLNFDTKIKVIKVKGHANNEYNNLADKLAVAGSLKAQKEYLNSLKR